MATCSIKSAIVPCWPDWLDAAATPVVTGFIVVEAVPIDINVPSSAMAVCESRSTPLIAALVSLTVSCWFAVQYALP